MMALKWKQIDACTWQAKSRYGYSYQISFGDFSGVYSICRFDDDSAVGLTAFDELDAAKKFCEFLT